jgi:hypothetical protein
MSGSGGQGPCSEADDHASAQAVVTFNTAAWLRPPRSLASPDGYGALSGKAVAVEPSTGFTFDTPLLPRLR